MAYDPRRDRPRRRTDENESSPVDSLLDGGSQPPAGDRAPAADPAPSAAPAAAGPTGSWTDRLLYSGGFSTMLKTAIIVAALGWLWRRLRRSRSQ